MMEYMERQAEDEKKRRMPHPKEAVKSRGQTRPKEVGKEEDMVGEGLGDGPYLVLPLVPCLLLNRSPSSLTPALTLLVAP